MTKRMIVMLILVIVVFGGVFGMKWFGNKMLIQYVENMPVPPATITAAPVQTMTWGSSVEAIGSFVPVNGTDVTTESGGIVTAIHFESGATVAKGAPLVSLDSANDRGEYRRLQAQAELAELNRARREKLLKLEAISKSDYDAAVSEANAAQAAVEAQAAKVAQKNINAPFAGTLGIRRINVGQFLSPGTAIVNLQSLKPIDIDFALPEQRMGTVNAGFKINVKVDSYPDLDFEGTVMAIEPKVDEATRSFRLRARLPNEDTKLRPGQFGKVTLALPGEKTVLVVPRTSINYSSYGTSVFVIEKKKNVAPKPEKEEKPAPGTPPPTDLQAVQRFVKIGEGQGDFVSVIDGLKEGEQVATSGLLKLHNEQPVIINNSVSPQPELNPTPKQG